MSSDSIEVFISYSKQDKEFRDGLLAHLRPLEAKGIITWHDRQILPGTRWDEEIKARLNAADIILLLISADFLNTDYCIQVEIPEALRRHQAAEAIVMPVILRFCAWEYTALSEIQAYPEKANPIKSSYWQHIDEAYTDVVKGVYLAATEIQKRRSQKRQLEEQERLRQAEQLRQQQAAEAAARLKQQEELERQRQEQLKQEADKKRRQEQAQQPPSEILKGNYAHLETLLKAGQWKEADQETARQMCQVMGRQEEGWLRIEDIKQFPCADLRTIDRLWVKYSNGKFGFSVQKKIWQRCGSPTEYNKQWEKFGEEVGWRSKGIRGNGSEWKLYSELTFDVGAPIGHLPFRFLFVGCGGGVRFCVGVLFSRAEMCNL